MKNNSSHIILGRIVIFLIVCSIAGLEMVAAAGGERGHIKNQSFTFQPGDIQTNEVPRGFEELWPHNESYHSTATPDCRGQEIDCSLEALLKDNVAMFRETLELPRRNHATTLHKLLRDTLEDLKCTYPKCTSRIQISEDIRASTAQVLLSLYKVLKYVGDIWAGYQSENYRADKDKDIETLSSQQIGERVLDGLSYMSSRANEMFDLLDKDSINNTHQRIDHSNLFSPLTPTSVLPEVLEYQSNSKESQNLVHIAPFLRPLRLQAVGKLTPMDIKRLSFHMSPLMVDQESHRMHQTDNVNGDLELDFPDASMSVETNMNSIIGNDGGNNPEGRTSEATALTSASTQPRDHPLQLRKSVSSKAVLDVPSSPHIHQAMSVEQKVDDPSNGDGWNGKMSKSSEATILLASQPIMQVQTPHIHQAMSVRQKVDDSSKCDDCNGKMSKPAEASILPASQPIMHLQTPHIHQAMSVGQKVDNSSKCDDRNAKMSTSSEATILLAPQSIMHVQAPQIHQAMSKEQMVDDSSKCGDCNGKMIKSPEAAIPLAPQPTMRVHAPHIHHVMRVEKMVDESRKCGDCNGKMSKSSEATVLLAPQPMMHIQTTKIPSAPPTPPSSPMVLTGMYMPFFDPTMNMESIAFAMSADDIEDMDADNGSKPSKPAISVKAPPIPTSQYRETQQKPLPPPLPPPPPAASVQQKEIPVMQEPCTVKLPLPPPPPPPTRSVPVPPPPPHSKCSTASPAPPPLPPLAPGSAPLPPVSSGAAGSAPPPPPPAMKSLRAKKNTKLKRSSQMGNMYRVLKGKVEGSSLNGKKSQGKKGIGGKSSGNSAQGMADALAEITKRSSYFQQIEEDVKNHSTVILELKSSVSSFRTKDISELTKFHKQVEIHLEKLSDESQVLARFEGFPTKKLETIRMAVALYSKLEEIAKTLKSWKVVSPVAQQLDKVESYFNKIKEDVDATDRNKDEESKRFKSHNIEIDFNVLVRIKESMVDLSSNCIETALKEAKEAKSASKEANSKGGSHCKMLWTAFQLSFRVYNFAGGQDERADRLTSELAHEIEMCQF